MPKRIFAMRDRPRRCRAGQGDGRPRHRLRLIRREACLHPRARRRRDGELCQRESSRCEIGLAAAELGKVMGARVIACASSDEKLAFTREHGADETVNYAKENLRDARSDSPLPSWAR